ncbi:MAG: ClpXP protease specificity-enhancing factor [Gammaproteobacteria bacterium]|nr:ClpXP protease specificity-enhancing factor [Gammaproteobacteria bacterium]
MGSNRPYLLRAIHEWIVDNGCTPHLLVDANVTHCVVPQQFVKDGVIVLNISPSAVKDLSLGNEYVMFSARFGGIAREITVPVGAVRAIYARENGQGMAFEGEGGGEPPEGGVPPPETPSKPKTPPRLSVVK